MSKTCGTNVVILGSTKKKQTVRASMSQHLSLYGKAGVEVSEISLGVPKFHKLS